MLLSAAVTFALLSLSVAQSTDESLNSALVDLPEDPVPEDFQLLKSGLPLVGSVLLGASRTFRFGLPEIEGKYPSALISLYVSNPHGDADLYCAPWAWLEGDRVPGPGYSTWSSYQSQHEDSVFLSPHNYVYNLSKVSLPEKNNITVAAIACTIRGESLTRSEFELEIDLSTNDMVLVKEERNAMVGIFKRCCQEEDRCLPWYHAEGPGKHLHQLKNGKTVELDFCHRYGNVCTPEGRLRVLNMKGYGMSCDFPVDEFSKMTSLEKLDVDWNEFRGDIQEILDGLSGLENLHRLSATMNKIDGSFSSSQQACRMYKRLRFINLGGNEITGRLPGCLLGSKSLLEFHLYGNKVFGEIPDTVPEDSNLEALNLGSNSLRGPIPESLGNARFLRYLTLANNGQLSGPIPESLGTLPRMERLSLALNKFTQLPKAWVSPDWVPSINFHRVNISRNSIKGQFPFALGKAPYLESMDVSDNQLTGPLAIRENSFQMVARFNASFNSFSGPIPSAVAGMLIFEPSFFAAPNNQYFDVRHNQLSGEIPEVFYELKATGVSKGLIHVGGNEFACKEPSELKHITGLQCVSDKEGSLLGQAAAKPGGSEGGRNVDPGVIAGAAIGSTLALVLIVAMVVVFAIVVLRRRKARSMDQIMFAEECDANGDVEIGTIKVQDADSILPQQVPRS